MRPEQAQQAKAMVEAGQIDVEMAEITSRIFIEAIVTAEEGEAAVTIRDTHTNIVRITENGSVVYEKEAQEEGQAGGLTDAKDSELPLVHRYTLAELHNYAFRFSALQAGGKGGQKAEKRLLLGGLHKNTRGKLEILT